MGFPGSSVVKNLTASVRHKGLTPGLRRSVYFGATTSPPNTWPSISLKSLVAYPSTRLKSLNVTLAFFVKKIISRYTKAIKRGDELHIYNYLKITGTSQETQQCFQ